MIREIAGKTFADESLDTAALMFELRLHQQTLFKCLEVTSLQLDNEYTPSKVKNKTCFMPPINRKDYQMQGVKVSRQIGYTEH